MSRYFLLASFAIVFTLGLPSSFLSWNQSAGAQDAKGAEDSAAKKPNKKAVERSRKTVQMLDNIFKQTVVMVTDKYVNDEDHFAAGSAAVLLFKNISESSDNKVRLIDATGDPHDFDRVSGIF